MLDRFFVYAQKVCWISILLSAFALVFVELFFWVKACLFLWGV